MIRRASVEILGLFLWLTTAEHRNARSCRAMLALGGAMSSSCGVAAISIGGAMST